jgi:hypothetical protein
MTGDELERGRVLLLARLGKILSFDEKAAAQLFRILNIQRCAEAMDLLYKTYIIEQPIAIARGEAIQAINRMILALGGEDIISKIEAVPFTARLRASGEPELVQLAKDILNGETKEKS